METNIISKLLKNFKCFKGVYPLDKLPDIIKLPINIIINTDPSYMPGEHWVSLSINKDCYGEYFDSLGLPPLKKKFSIIWKKIVKKGGYIIK